MAPGDGVVVVLVWVVAFGVDAAELECEGVLVAPAAVRVGCVDLAGVGLGDFVFPGAVVVGAVLVPAGVVVLELDTVWPEAALRVVAETNSGDAETLVLALAAVAPLAPLAPDAEEVPEDDVPLWAEVS
jgi:hypothetical protein